MFLLIFHRVWQTCVTMLILTVIIFGLARLTGDPTPLVMPSEATEADRTFFREQYGLDQNIFQQYFVFMGNVLTGNFGTSFRQREAAFDIVLSGVGPTLWLASASMVLAIVIGVSLGCLSAIRPHGFIDRASNVFASMAQATPTFWVALILVMLLAVKYPLFPSSGYGTWAHFVLPTLTLGLYSAGSIIRLTRANMVEVLNSDFIYMGRILGYSETSIVLKHALRNAGLPIITFMGLQFGILLGGAVVTERIFAWPGLGQIVVDAILGRDYPVVQATILFTAFLFLMVNLLVDCLIIILNPRLRDA